MKKLIILALCIINYAFGFAQNYVELDKISDIRAQKEGTYVIYTGKATTTFYGPGGILIQDETGAIYVKSYDMSNSCADPADAGFPNLKITYIAGVFHKATDMEMTQIEIEYAEDAYGIEVVEENVDFTITDVALEDLMTNPMAYECQAIRLTKVSAEITTYSKYFKLGDKELPISTGQMGEAMNIPAEGTFVGYYGNNGNQGFIIPSSQYITPTAYKSIYDIKNSRKTGIELGILDPVLVNRVVKNDDGSTTLYIQEDYSWWGTYGTTVIVENLIANVQEGDSITGIRGYVTPFRVENETEVYGSKIEQKENLGANIIVKNSNNPLTSVRVQELEYIKGEATANYEATLCATPAGTIVKHDDKYYLQILHSNTNETDSILIYGADFSSLVGSKHALIGIVDAGIINPGKTTLVLRSANDILLDNYQFNTIAEMRAAGRPLAADVTYELVNPVLVTYKREYNIDGVDLIGVHVQDETGGYYIKKQVTADEKFDVNAGDSVTNFKGVFVNTAGTGYMLDFSDINNTQEDPFKIISSGNAVDENPIDVTIDELAANPNKYSSRVVRLKNVMQGDTTYTPWWTEGYPVTDYYLYQEGSPERMFYSSWKYPLYEKNNIVGIFDDACDTEGFTIIPLSPVHITNAEEENETNVEFTSDNNISVAYNNNTIFFSSDVDAIEIYNTNGALIMQQNAYTNSISINLNKGIYIVRLFSNNEITTCKIAVK